MLMFSSILAVLSKRFSSQYCVHNDPMGRRSSTVKCLLNGQVSCSKFTDGIVVYLMFIHGWNMASLIENMSSTCRFSFIFSHFSANGFLDRRQNSFLPCFQWNLEKQSSSTKLDTQNYVYLKLFLNSCVEQDDLPQHSATTSTV